MDKILHFNFDEQKPNLLKVVFDPKYGIKKHLGVKNYRQVAQKLLLFFYTEVSHLNDYELIDLISELKNFDDFNKYYNNVKKLSELNNPAHDGYTFTLHTEFGVFTFDTSNTQYYKDPRISIVKYYPVDDHTLRLLSSIS